MGEFQYKKTNYKLPELKRLLLIEALAMPHKMQKF